ncbi:MAG: fatty acyl-AMP ligase [Bacteroidia bacterium]
MFQRESLSPTTVTGSFSTLVQLLRHQAMNLPDARAYAYLENGEEIGAVLTYAEVDTQARAIAARLQALRLRGERALLLYPSGLDYVTAFFGCLYAGVIAVPVYPPQMGKQWDRIQSIIDDSGAAICLTNRQILDGIRRQTPEVLDDLRQEWLLTDGLDSTSARDWTAPDIDGSTIAFLQYTSGSTGTPKGVCVTHANLLHNAAMTATVVHHEAGKAPVVSWLPLFHDMGLIGVVIQCLYTSSPCYVMTPLAFLQKPLRWLQAIERFGAVSSGAPNFAYDLCVDKIAPEEVARLDLRCWRNAFNGAEPVRAATLERFAAHFAPAGFAFDRFWPCYGMAEATLLITAEDAAHAPRILHIDRDALGQGQARAVEADHAHAQAMVSCGYPWAGQELRIVDPDTLHTLPEGRTGEIWAAGESICDGYWNRETQSQETFGAHTRDTGEGPFLRTGDLGFVLDGHLYIAGRLKDLIIVRGRNHHPNDIEQVVEVAHPAFQVGGCAVFSIDACGEERLVVVQEIERGALRKDRADSLFAVIRQQVASVFELQAFGIVLITRRTLPKTSSGKVQRQATRRAYLEGRLAIEAAWHMELELPAEEEAASVVQARTQAEFEAWIVAWMAAKLGISPRKIYVADPITAYGIDSMMVAAFESDVAAFLGVHWPVSDFLLTEPSIEDIARRGISFVENGE